MDREALNVAAEQAAIERGEAIRQAIESAALPMRRYEAGDYLARQERLKGPWLQRYRPFGADSHNKHYATFQEESSQAEEGQDEVTAPFVPCPGCGAKLKLSMA